MRKAMVFGGGGFIGSHLVKRLKKEGFWVRAVDLKLPEFWDTEADDFIIDDLRDPKVVSESYDTQFDEVYQLAADMGGAGFVFTGENDADIMHNSCLININVLHEHTRRNQKGKIFYSSSACIYPEHNQLDPDNPNCEESSAYPANPDSDYGWEKLYSERLYFAFHKNKGTDAYVARYHNIFGPYGSWKDGREKAPAAICRKVTQAADESNIEIWGDGKQTRSFMYVDECIEATTRLIRSDFRGPVNIGSEEMVTINELAEKVINISGKNISIKHIDGPLGVRGRNSDNNLIEEKLKWRPERNLQEGLEETYKWITKVNSES